MKLTTEDIIAIFAGLAMAIILGYFFTVAYIRIDHRLKEGPYQHYTDKEWKKIERR